MKIMARILKEVIINLATIITRGMWEKIKLACGKRQNVLP